MKYSIMVYGAAFFFLKKTTTENSLNVIQSRQGEREAEAHNGRIGDTIPNSGKHQSLWRCIVLV